MRLKAKVAATLWFPRAIPTVKQHGFRQESFIGDSMDAPLPEMVVFRLAIGLSVINPIVDRVMFPSVYIHQVHDANTAHQATFRNAILFFD